MPLLPLLRLPRLVLFEVFKSLNIGEKIKLSFCSKKVSTQINDARLYSQKVIVDLDMVQKNIEVQAENKKDKFGIFICYDSGTSNNPHIQRCRIDGHIVPVMPSCIMIITLWKNHQEGFLSVIQHLLKMFQCKISIKSNCCNGGLFHSTISKLFNLQLEFKKLTIKLGRSEDQKLLWNQISCSLGLVENLNISSIPNPSFSPVFTSWPLKISIWSSAWVTLESFLTCTSTRIEFGGSHLRNKDVNEVLRNWKAGGFPNLEYLYIEGQSITNNGTPILGMKLSELDGKDIQTDDGSKKANVRIRTGCMRMSVTPFQ